MTELRALSVPVRPLQDASLRPLPWRRMAWVTWRQHRFALTGVAAVLGALAVYLLIVGHRLHHAYAAASACHPASSIACEELVGSFNGTGHLLATSYALQALPALIGAFVGAPLLARELETGTFRYAWTQGFGPWRWTLAKLIALAVVLAAAAGALSALLTWYYQPYLAAGNHTLSLSEVSPLAGTVFDLRGVALAAWTLAAFAIGGLAGVLIRRVLPAILATLAAYAGLALATGLFLRRHYLTALLTSNPNVPASAWITRQWGTKAGKLAFTGQPPKSLLEALCPPSAVGPLGPRGKPSPGTLAQCISRHGYALWTSYQPAGRFWTFQWIEGGWLLALSMLLIATTVWLVRRRRGLTRRERTDGRRRPRRMHTHGVPGFPDPTSSGQVTHEMLAGAGINVHQPAVLQDADACVSVTHGVLTREAVARLAAGD
ncbi:MAG TPA: hypothetical protein VMF09_03965 [Solirubrobacteraceae bacterium]|nr:hypothetical protein [Solirubrobacteraceae bacterium]